MILKDTKGEWDGHDVRKLRIELSELISPAIYTENIDQIKKTDKDPGFKINFNCPEFPSKEETLSETFFKNAWAKLTGEVDENGETEYKLEVKNKVINEFTKTFEKNQDFNKLKNAELEIYIFQYKSGFFKNSEWAKTRAAKLGRKRGGIKVYSDNFRVFGYGDRGDDWLDLDYDRSRSKSGLSDQLDYLIEGDKRPGLRLFMNRNLFGYVVFSSEDNPDLEITVNREKLVEDKSFLELKRFVRLGVEFATVCYSNEVYKKKNLDEKKEKKEKEEKIKKEKKEVKKAKEEKEEAEKAYKKAKRKKEKLKKEAKKAEEKRKRLEERRREIEKEKRQFEDKAIRSYDSEKWDKVEQLRDKEKEFLKREEKAIKEESKLKRKIENTEQKIENIKDWEYKAIQETEEKLRKLDKKKFKDKKEKYEKELSMLRVLASTGTLIFIFEHEISSLLEDFEDMVETLNKVKENLDEGPIKEELEDILKLSDKIGMINELGNFLGLTIGKESREERKDWALKPLIDKVIRPFEWYLDEFEIKFEVDVPSDLRVPQMYRSELTSILHNLLSNAFKAVKGCPRRKIKISAFEKNNQVYLRCKDTGEGLEKEKWDEVFEPFESNSEPDIRFGTGTGLGLKLVRDIVRKYEGEARFIETSDEWSTCIEIVLPKGE